MVWSTPTFKQRNLRLRLPRHSQSSFTAGVVKVSQQRRTLNDSPVVSPAALSRSVNDLARHWWSCGPRRTGYQTGRAVVSDALATTVPTSSSTISSNSRARVTGPLIDWCRDSPAGSRERQSGDPRVSVQTGHGRCVKQRRRPENRARNRTRKALLLLALSCGPLCGLLRLVSVVLFSGVVLLSLSAVLRGLLSGFCACLSFPSFHGRRPKNRALRQVPPIGRVPERYVSLLGLYWVRESLFIHLCTPSLWLSRTLGSRAHE